MAATEAEHGFRQINDDELLALVGQRPGASICTRTHSEELFFANLEDQKGFPLNQPGGQAMRRPPRM
jgi:hypothetical protein